MKWLDRLERKYHKYAIPNLIQYIVGGMAIVFVFNVMNPGILSSLYFEPNLVLQGQVWRLLTFLFIPRTTSFFWIIFSLLFTFFVGRTLEQYWGTFKFNVYYLIGALGTIVVGILLGLVSSGPVYLYNDYLNMSLFLALCMMIPEYEIRIYMILPVKLKYLGYVYGGFLGLQLLVSLVTGTWSTVLEIVISMANFLIFFGPGLLNKRKQNYRRQQFKQANRQPHKTRTRTKKPGTKEGQVIQVAFHCCEVCGKTEVDDPNLEFRYCSKCGGRHEYCSEHILDHQHHKV